jgi:hypothetical protein
VRARIQPKEPKRSGCALPLAVLAVALAMVAMAVGLWVYLTPPARADDDDDGGSKVLSPDKRSATAEAPSASAPAQRSGPLAKPKPQPGAGKTFDEAAGQRALSSAASRASRCSGGKGSHSVQVAWGASGGVIAVFARSINDTSVRNCVDAAFRSARVPRFDSNAQREATGDHRKFLTTTVTFR